MGGGNSKVEYQECVNRLLVDQAVSPGDVEFWKKFWVLPSSVDDIFAGVKPEDIRKIKQDAPRNLAILLNKVGAAH